LSELLHFNATTSLLPTEDILNDVQIDDVVHRFGFKIGRHGFVLEKTLTTEILIKPTIYTIPNSPKWVVGMVNLRSNILPVIDLSSVLRMQYVNNPGDFVLVIDKGRESIALLVDDLPKLLKNPTQAEQVSGAEYVAEQYVQPGVMVKGDIWDQIDIKHLVHGLKDLMEN